MKFSIERIRTILLSALIILVAGASVVRANDSAFELEKGKPFPIVKFLDRQKNISDLYSSSAPQNKIIIFTVSNDKKTPELLDLVNRIVAASTENVSASVVFLDQNLDANSLAKLDNYSNIHFFFDPNRQSVKQFQIYITPMIYLIDSKGNLFNLIVGYSFFTPQVLLVSTEKLIQKNLDFLIQKHSGSKD